MAYQHTKEEQLIDKFAQVFDYCYAKVLPDTNNIIVRVFFWSFRIMDDGLYVDIRIMNM